MSSKSKLSVVIPVRDEKDTISSRVEEVLEALIETTTDLVEVIVVDDGSRDGTHEIVSDLERRFLEVRMASHTRPRGMEAAGQTGLERATGDLVFIQETNTPVRIEDLQTLLKMSEDTSIVAARAESSPRPMSPPLMRRLKAWGTKAIERKDPPEFKTSLQMLRRPHLQHLASPAGPKYHLHGETIHTTSVIKD